MKVNYIDDEKIIEDAVKDAKASLEIEGFNISKDEEEELIKSLVSNYKVKLLLKSLSRNDIALFASNDLTDGSFNLNHKTGSFVLNHFSII